MNLAAVSQPVLLKLLQLDQIAQQLSAAADRLDARVDNLRHKGSGSGWNAAIEAELKELLAAQPKARQRADRAQHTASGCKAFLDRLPDDAVLDVVEVKPTGDLRRPRAQIVELMEERKSIINAPPSPSELSAEVKGWVDEQAARGDRRGCWPMPHSDRAGGRRGQRPEHDTAQHARVCVLARSRCGGGAFPAGTGGAGECDLQAVACRAP